MNILPLPAFTDNYIWLIEENGKATVVDPGDAEVVNYYLKEKKLELENILITHHHFDHTGGVKQLKEMHECNVYGPHDSPFSGVEIKLPEKNPSEAWAKLSEMDRSESLLSREINVIDLRKNGYLIIKPSENYIAERST